MSDANVRYVGLDVHKRVIEACLLAADGQVLRRARLALTRHYLETYARKVLRPTERRGAGGHHEHLGRGASFGAARGRGNGQ